MPYPHTPIAVSAAEVRFRGQSRGAARLLAGIDLVLTGRLLAVALLLSLVIITG